MAINDSNMVVNGRGLLAIAADGTRLQMPTKFQMEDATGTTIKSPLTVSSTEIDLIVPTNSVWFVVRAVGADLRIAITNTGTGATPYYVLKDGNTESFPVASVAGSGVASIFLLRDASTDVVVHFRFELIGK